MLKMSEDIFFRIRWRLKEAQWSYVIHRCTVANSHINPDVVFTQLPIIARSESFDPGMNADYPHSHQIESQILSGLEG